jgi:beta-xylosidase
MKIPLLLLAGLALLLTFSEPRTARAQSNQTAYVFSSFRGDGDGLHLAWSRDAYHWTDFGRVFLRPTVGGKLFRDAHILAGPDGVFRMVWTTGWNDTGIGYASSTNLVDWSEQKFLPFMSTTPGTRNCWAPETFYDAANSQYIIFWSSDVAGRFPETVSPNHMNNRAYYVVTKDFVTFSEPKVLFDPGFDNIDSTMIAAGDKFMLVFKQGDEQALGKWGPIHAAVADHPLGPYQLQPQPLITERAEGPTLITIDGKTLLYVDFYGAGHYGAYESTDWKTWTDVSAQAAPVSGQRHGTVLAIAPQLLDNLLHLDDAAMAAVPKPILDGYTADPAIRVFGDTYYVYPTSDKPNWMTTDFSVWSSTNLVDWKKEGMILDVTKDLKWANIKAWAPDCVERNGKFYFYFCADGRIGVGTADKPTGPFVDALGQPLVQRNDKIHTYTIDPYPLIDDDGQAYLYFGNGTLTVSKLKPDMITLDGDPATIRLKEFREGIVVFKRLGKYYFMWSIDDARSDNYRIGYGIADSPYGPVTSPTNNFIVLQKHGLVKGTGHHSVVNVPGTDRWYVAYHRHAIPGGSGFKRETCLVQMKFNPDGTIQPMDPMEPAFPPGSDGEPIINGKGRP